MSEQIILTLSDELNEEAQRLATENAQSLEELIVQRLSHLLLPLDIQNELEALAYLSEDTLWTIAREQMPKEIQARADELMSRNNLGLISAEEYAELELLSERADRLILRKAEAAHLLKKQGHNFTQADFKAHD